MMLVALLSHKHFRTEIVVDLCFSTPRREAVTTRKRLLVPLDKLKLIVSNIGSLLMASLL